MFTFRRRSGPYSRRTVYRKRGGRSTTVVRKTYVKSARRRRTGRTGSSAPALLRQFVGTVRKIATIQNKLRKIQWMSTAVAGGLNNISVNDITTHPVFSNPIRTPILGNESACMLLYYFIY